MYLYLKIYFFITALSATASYVLLAANIEDFRSLAKQFVPDEMADEFFEIAKDLVVSKNHNKNSEPEFRGDEPVPYVSAEYNEPLDSTPKTQKTRTGNHKKATKGTTSKYELSLDDLVEKVKERLKIEITQMASDAAHKFNLQKATRSRNSPNFPNKSTIQPYDLSDTEVTQEQPKATKRDRVENKSQKQEYRDKKPYSNTVNKQYLAEMFVAQPPQYMYDRGQPVELDPKMRPSPKTYKTPLASHGDNVKETNKLQRKKRIRQEPVITTKSLVPFVGVNLMKTNDSYEDYVTPVKDNDYLEPKQESTHKAISKTMQENSLSTRNKKILDIFSDEYDIVTKDEHHDQEDSTNYNHKNKVTKMINKEKTNKLRIFNREPNSLSSIVPLVDASIETDRILPYAEQLEESIYADETVQTTTEEPKARSEGINFNEYTGSQYIAPLKQDTHKKKTNKRPRQATVIPKRDMYKMSSPNYLVKIPIVGEKYRFDEPIPEEDREPENLKPINIPPGIVNGKILQ